MPAFQKWTSSRRFLGLAMALATPLTAVPVANNDSFEVDEDGTLVISSGGSIVSATFEGGSSVLSPTWEYLDRIETQNGSAQTYPLDGNGLVWSTRSLIQRLPPSDRG